MKINITENDNGYEIGSEEWCEGRFTVLYQALRVVQSELEGTVYEMELKLERDGRTPALKKMLKRWELCENAMKYNLESFTYSDEINENNE